MNDTQIREDSLSTLYNSGKSMFEIAQYYNCSPHKIVYWMDKFNIKRRSRSEAGYIKLNPNGDPFNIKTEFNLYDTFLYGIGLGIYWGEGEKVSRNSLRVANTDPYILITFSKFLKTICNVKSEKMRYSLVCFNDIDENVAKAYWSKILKISEDKFGKIVNIPTQGKGKYKRKSQFGVCTLTVSNTKLKTWIMEEIDKIKNPPV